MSEPLHAWRGEKQEPRPNLIPDKQPTDDSVHADRGARTNGWFHSIASRPALRAVAPTREPPPPAPADDHASGSRRGRPATPSASPMSEEQRWLSLRNGTHPLSLTWEQIGYSVARERIIDAFTDEQYWHDTVLFDQAIDDDRYWHNGRLCDRPMDAEPEIDDPEIG
ncbi:hypothetical protein EAS64_38550 [Trebonia kvetii]|uniref:Uncharacterized protein n=1 Tax=Trebonia kvetii TaxID=2480626 RepID=A0A6P2BRU0_9ACTN|nr:hypothetical protein [Trebonia kvetii]TVY99992.1 hypothetical protein EAS64_38550 [Trebonia kvetii]